MNTPVTTVRTIARPQEASTVPSLPLPDRCESPCLQLAFQRLPEVELRHRLWTSLQANDRWETTVTVVLGAAGVAAIVWAIAAFLETNLP